MTIDTSDWTSSVLAHTPGIMDRDRDDFFQLVPPTPHILHPFPLDYDAGPQGDTATDASVPFPLPLLADDDEHYLRPMPSDSSLSISLSHRSHRSMSSFSSHSQSQSHYGGGWSTTTIDSESEINFDDDPFAPAEEHAASSVFSGSENIDTTPSHSVCTGNLTGVRSQSHSRAPSLSIDPRLFAPRDLGRQRDLAENNDNDKDIEVTPLRTAKPAVDRSLNPPQTARAQTKWSAQAKSGNRGGGSPTSPKNKGRDGDKKKISHARKQTADHIPRPRNAFILFRKHVVDAKLIPASVEMRHQNVSIITAKMWSEAPPDQKAHFNELARIEKEEHMKKYPGYRYQPVYRRTNVIRRRVRKDEAEEAKCRSVAELLIKGKSGDALEEEIKDNIRRGSEAGSGSSRNSRSTSRRESTACELSKGALRALRAQARSDTRGSGEWSDISRGTSMDHDVPPLRPPAPPINAYDLRQACNGRAPLVDQTRSRRSSVACYSQDENELPGDLSPPSVDGNVYQPGLSLPGFAVDPTYAQAQSQAQMGVPDQWGESMSYMHPETTTGWMFQPELFDSAQYPLGLQGQLEPHSQSMATRVISNSGSGFTSTATSSSDQQPYPFDSDAGQTFLYPQPQGTLPSQHEFSDAATQPGQQGHAADFYAYDVALPFSPSAGQGFNFPTDVEMRMTYDYSSLEALLAQQGRINARPPMSARWDKGHLLPPSSEVPLEGLPFDETAMMFGEFDNVVVHPEDVGVW